MLELAIAEAYRPRPSQHSHSRPPPQPPSRLKRRPETEAGSQKSSNTLSGGPSFAKNPNVSARVPAFSLRSLSLRSSRPSSAISTASTATVRPARSSGISRFARRWTATPSTLAETGIEEGLNDMKDNVERIDSVVASIDHERSTPTPTFAETSFAAKSFETKIAVGDEPKGRATAKVQRKTQDSTAEPEYYISESTYNDGLELPSLISRVPLPPQEELEPFDTALQSAIDDLLFFARPKSLNTTPNPINPDPDPSTTTLSHLSHLSDLSACIAVSWLEYWALITHAVSLLVSILPSQHPRVTNTLIRCLVLIAQAWEEEQNNSGRGMVEIADLAGEVIDELLREQEARDETVSAAFAAWVATSSVDTVSCRNDAWTTIVEKGDSITKGILPFTRSPLPHEQTRRKESRTLHILALSLSPTVKDAVIHALTIGNLTINLSILSITTSSSSFHHSPAPYQDISLPSPLQSRLRISKYPFIAQASLAQEVDVLLLPAQSIDSNANAVCEQGALSAAVCVKTLGRGRVVVLCSVDDVFAMTADRADDGTAGGGNFEERGGEAVSKSFADVYMTEKGVLEVQEIEGLARRAGELARHVFSGRD